MDSNSSKSLIILQIITVISFAFGILCDPQFFGEFSNFPWLYYVIPGILLFSSFILLSTLWFQESKLFFYLSYFSFLAVSILGIIFLCLLAKNELAMLLLASSCAFFLALVRKSKIGRQIPVHFLLLISFYTNFLVLIIRNTKIGLDNSLSHYLFIFVCIALLASILSWIFMKIQIIKVTNLLVQAILFIFNFVISISIFSSKLSSLLILYWILIIVLNEKIDATKTTDSRFTFSWVGNHISLLLVLTLTLEFAALSFFMIFPVAMRNLDASILQSPHSWGLIMISGLTFLSLFVLNQYSHYLKGLDENLKYFLDTKISKGPLESPNFSPPFFDGKFIQQLKTKINNFDSKSLAIKDIMVKQEILQNTIDHRQSRLKLGRLSKIISEIRGVQDPPVTAQIISSSLQNEVKCNLVAIYSTHAEENRLIPLAVASQDDLIKIQDLRIRPSNEYINQAIRMQKCLIFQKKPDLKWQDIQIGGSKYKSTLIDPLFQDGVLQGLILLADEKDSFFDESDGDLIEIAGSEIISSWNQAGFLRSLEKLIDNSTALSNINDLQSILKNIVEIGQIVLRNRFSAVIIQTQEKLLYAFYGKFPEIKKSIENSLSKLTFFLLKQNHNLIYRDLQREKIFSHIILDEANLRTLMIVPIQIHGVNIGSFLFFGKRKANTFSEKDSFLAGILSMQASSLIEGCILDQELRNNLISTQLLHGLNLRITQANDLETAVKAVTETAHRLMRAKSAGSLLFSLDDHIEASSVSSSSHSSQEHPKDLIRKSMKSKKVEIQKIGANSSIYCFPLYTSQRTYGGLWCEISEGQYIDEKLSGDIHDLVQQASIALERAILLKETRDNADQVSLAYFQLQSTYDQTLMALVSAVDLRDSETEGHSIRVAQLALSIGKELGLNNDQLKSLERGSLLHDIGKIGINDEILHKPGSLTQEEWGIMKLHPRMGAQIIESIPFLRDAVPVVAFHQERWDGSGYPNGLKGEDIPLLARIFAVADVFDALISDRPYHKRLPPQDAVEYLKFQANILFDSSVIKAFIKLYEQPNFLRKIGFYEL